MKQAEQLHCAFCFLMYVSCMATLDTTWRLTLSNRHSTVESHAQIQVEHTRGFLKTSGQLSDLINNPACSFFGQSDSPGPYGCSLRQAWRSVDALVGRLSSAYEDHGRNPKVNPFRAVVVRIYLREDKDTQNKARGISDKKRKKLEIKVAYATTHHQH
ncbi:hypothetical protein Golob_004728 [Gossypium lobatum]|uniref:ALOG domain-containing protein n=1 Tax=Gossypium lobatum TaxID=34289 RepID=A0A7J8N298_9ROSI|nr:hypothetical protein [Gossypium lobatum]